MSPSLWPHWKGCGKTMRAGMTQKGVNTMRWPQITIIVMYALSFGTELSRHGKPKEGVYNAWYSLIGTVIGIAILYCGGFFG